MLNFRKLKQDFSSNILKEGRELKEKKKVVFAKILKVDNDSIRLGAKVMGNYDNTYESEIEIDRFESQAIHSNCDCSYRYDCQHLAALLFYLEEKMDSLLVEYSKETDIEEDDDIDDSQKEELLHTIKEAESNEVAKKDARYQKQVLGEYVSAANTLSDSPFFQSPEKSHFTEAELAFIFNPKSLPKKRVEFQLALRLPTRSKPLQVAHIKNFLEAIRYDESITLIGKKYFFSMMSFSDVSRIALKLIMDNAHFPAPTASERAHRVSLINLEVFGTLLSQIYDADMQLKKPRGFANNEQELPTLPFLYWGNLETPLHYCPTPALIRFFLEYLEPPSAKILLRPTLDVNEQVINLEEAIVFECNKPGLIHGETFYRFAPHIKRRHLQNLENIREMTIPEPLFGTFVENSLPVLKRYAEVAQENVLDRFVTLPYAGDLEARCELSYLDGELEATLYFNYDGQEVPAIASKLGYKDIESFVSEEGILARNLIEEKQIIENLFQDFVFNPTQGNFVAKTEKKIVEFMTEIIPQNQHRVSFECPQNLLDQFIYDQSQFTLKLDYKNHVGFYELDLKVEGKLKGVKLDLLWDCVASKRSFIELDAAKINANESRFSKILVLDLEKITRIAQLFDELGIKKLDSHKEERPLWNLVTIDEKLFENLPINFSMTKKLQEIRQQMLGEKEVKPSAVPKEIQTTLRPYQEEGVYWLEKLRKMYLNGVLADDMGLGKTLQAITAITQHHSQEKNAHTLIVCPTSLLYNWKEEIARFNPKLNSLVVDGIPSQRKKVLTSLEKYEVVITSYTLLQKDVDYYKEMQFSYAILDEAQHIKNRGTRNAKSVKMIQASHRLILTGTPIENSLEELWSLFDFLMPGFLSTFDRFVDKYLRSTGSQHIENIDYLRKKVSPFILRRMKSDVLDDLPPVDEIVYHCQLTDVQQELYKSYAQSARDELTKLVERDGFDKVQIHVLATLTRLKQICCHPAIFAKEKPEINDSAKYEMLLELLQTLVEGNHKTVIFSQYTRMLQIMKEDFAQKGIRFSYLDGSSKNRLEIVKDFNENLEIPVFLVSLKAGGTGLNLVGADTVIHYDMWWNPAVENQATDRVHRIGQKKSVSSYKLITKNTIEEKIVEMQRRKKGLVKKVVSCDDEAISKLTWEDVLELLQT
ncbi:MAG: DEAD/DEAH box helicase [Chlamydiota bacterium]|jgi:SNF2 family DNA or RNA helicase